MDQGSLYPGDTLNPPSILFPSWHKTTHHQIPDYHHHHEDNEAQSLSSHFHTVPHGLDPLPAEDAKDDKEGMEEVVHMPARQHTVTGNLADAFCVAFPKKLHAHHSKDENDDGQHKSEVAQGAYWVANDLDQHIKGRPGFGKFENSHLGNEKEHW